MNPPLILTLTLDDNANAFFNRLRKQHFPPERNFLDAHLTLFHHLPAQEPQVLHAIEIACARQQAITLKSVGIINLGRGVAYRLDSAALQQLHKLLQQHWHLWLTAQDRQPLRPHITVQNKVPPPAARELLQQLQGSFSPFDVQGIGVQVWEYQGGPWKWLHSFPFRL